MPNDIRPDEPLSVEDEFEAMRHQPYQGPAADRGETLAWTGVGIGVMGAGVVAASAICAPCMIGVAPLAALAAPVLIGAGAFKRWRSKKAAGTAAPIP